MFSKCQEQHVINSNEATVVDSVAQLFRLLLIFCEVFYKLHEMAVKVFYYEYEIAQFPLYFDKFCLMCISVY